MKYTYLLVNIMTVLFPLLFSFEKRFAFRRKWRFLFPAMFITGAIFILWDYWFTRLNIWYFNDQFILGYRIALLPLEEWLFFITIPYACTFVYEVVGSIYPSNKTVSLFALRTTLLLMLFFAIIAIGNYHKLYTAISFGFCAAALFFLWIFKASYLQRLLLTYLLLLVPFTLVNGILTGAFLGRVVVGYNNSENLGIRWLTIPVEDAAFGFLLFIITIAFYEFFRLKIQSNKS